MLGLTLEAGGTLECVEEHGRISSEHLPIWAYLDGKFDVNTYVRVPLSVFVFVDDALSVGAAKNKSFELPILSLHSDCGTKWNIDSSFHGSSFLKCLCSLIGQENFGNTEPPL